MAPHFPTKSTLHFASTSLVALLGLGLFSLATLSGTFFTPSSAHAETLDYNVNVEPALNVTIPTDTISLLLDPTNKTFSSQELNISVGTNNPYGYRLTMSSTGTSLVHTEDSNYTIPTLTSSDGGYTDESFTADRWGYKQDSSNWNSYTPGVTLLESNTPVNNDNTSLSFGAKIDYNQAPGNYTLVLNFNAVAKVATNDLVITFAGEGVNSVKVCKVAGDCTGDDLLGTVTTSGNSVPGLEDGTTYYLYPVFNANYEFVSWAKTSTAGTISATDVLNPTFTMSDEPAAVTITGKAQSYTCTKRYRLQNADGTYPSSYTADGTSSIAYGSTCSYTKSASYYTTQFTSCTMGTSGCTLSLDLPRTTYTLTVNRNTSYISSVSGAGTYRWGQVVSISASPATNSSFNGWTVSSGSTGSFGSSSSASTTYTMPQGSSTIYADGETSKLYIQDFTKAMCNSQAFLSAVTVYDKRDGNSYTVRYINGNCWMTQNLRFSGSSIDTTNTNTDTSKTISWGDLTSGNSYDVARYHNSGNTTNGYWYNYAGASAMTITGDSNRNNSTYDICPKNWRLPNYNEASSITSEVSDFSPVTGGFYLNGSLSITYFGFWWTSWSYDAKSSFTLETNGSSLFVNPKNAGYSYYDRSCGNYVRCIRSS